MAEEEGGNRAEYNRKYYQKKKADILARKRDRYNNDPEYREKMKKAAREQRRKRRGDTPKTPPVIEVGDIRERAHPVSTLAERINKSVSTINHWQRVKILPMTPFYSGGGHRLYTDSMITVIEQALSLFPRPGRGDDSFFQAVRNGWDNLGVPEVE
jgi:hypothetical protein